MKLSAARGVLVSGLLTLIFLSAINAHALYYWDGNGNTPGAGSAPSGSWDLSSSTWSTDENGTNAAAWPNLNSPPFLDGAIFAAGGDATGSYTITVNDAGGQIIVGDMHCDDGNPIIAGDPLKLGLTSRLISALPGHIFTINCALTNDSGTSDAFHKYKMGTLVLGGTNVYAGSTMIEGGTIKLGASQTIPSGSSLILGNGDARTNDQGAPVDYFIDTPPTFNTGGFTQILGALQLTGPNSTIPRTIDFETGQGTLSFANSSAFDWYTVDAPNNSASPGPISLTITNYAIGVTKLRFGSTSSGLTQAQLDQIHFIDYGNATGKIDGSGYVTPLLPSFKSVRIVSGQLEITWNSISGRTYQLDYRDSFSSAWTFLGFFNATGNTVTTTDSLAHGSRFYRVELVP